MPSPRLKLNHLSFPQRDAVKEAEFFERHFGAVIEFHDRPSGSVLIKHGEIDIVFEGASELISWPTDFHFGFELGTKTEVEAIYEQLKLAGARLESEIHNRIGRGSRFFGRTPGGIQFEVNTREDMNPRWIRGE